jgi:hypothetical protein
MALVVPSTLNATPVVGEQLFLQNILGVNASPSTELWVHLYQAVSPTQPDPATFTSQSTTGIKDYEQAVSSAISGYAPQKVIGPLPTPANEIGWQFSAGTGTITATTTAPVTFTLPPSTSGATINGYFVTNSQSIGNAGTGASMYWIEQFTGSNGQPISFNVSASGGTIQITLQLSLVNN